MRKFIFYLIVIIFLIFIGYWIKLGLHTIPSGKTGIVFLLGKPHRVEQPGRHWFFYKPVGKVITLPLKIVISEGEKFIISKEGIPLKTRITLACSLYDPLKFASKNGSIGDLKDKISDLLLKKFVSIPFENIINKNLGNIKLDVENYLSENGLNVENFKIDLLMDREAETLIKMIEKQKEEDKAKILKAEITAKSIREEAQIYANIITREAMQIYAEKIEAVNRIKKKYNVLEPLYQSHPDRIKKLINLQIIEETTKKAKHIYITPNTLQEPR